MADISSRYGSPGAAFLQPVGEVADFTTTGYGIVYRPNYLLTSDFSDAGENLASVSDNTFEADGNNYFVGQCVRLGANDGSNYVVEVVGGTTGTDTITLDRNIEESDGDDIFISQYKSLVTILDTSRSDTTYKRTLGDEAYPKNLYIFLEPKNGGTQGQLNLIFADEREIEITDFYPATFSDISLHPVLKVVRNDNNAATDLYYCKAF